MATVFPASQAIVVGGGLAGMTAANTILECGGSVTLLDKGPYCGGNSTKASSGISAANTRTQRMKDIYDTTESFVDDAKGGKSAKKAEVLQVMAANSGKDVEWLMDKFGLDLSLVARLAGHSVARVHRGAERFPGMTITYALIEMVEKIAENSGRARIICKARATRLLTNRNAVCVGVQYEYHGKLLQEHGPVILCSGGFGADFTSGGLLAKWRPDLLHLPTTNGEQTTGDGIKMGQAIGGSAIGLEWVEVHPTGFVKPDDPDAKLKFVAAELLRGVGGILLDSTGKRFVNELDTKDKVTNAMWRSSKAPFRLLLNSKASSEITWTIEHYKRVEVMKGCEKGEDVAKELDIDPKVLQDTFTEYNTAAAQCASMAPGAPYPALGGGKTWDKFGKTFFPNAPLSMEDCFNIAVVTPVIHYSVGGLEIDANSNVVDTRGRVIQGLYAAGEVAAGAHGQVRLAGNALLECVVFGRVAGKAAAKFMMPEIIPTSLNELSGKLKEAGAVVVQAAACDDDEDEGPSGITVEEVATHKEPGDVWIIVNNKVIDVSEFVKTHPGGEAAIMAFAGKDASVEWNMIHKPDFLDIHVKDKILGEVGTGKPSKPTGGKKSGGGISAEDVAAHDKPGDVWIIVNKKVIDVSDFVKTHPGGEAAIMAFAGKDASVEWNMIHKPDFLDIHVKDKILGEIGAGGGPPISKPKPKSQPGGGLTMEEVAKHNTKTDCWVVVEKQVLNVTKFLKDHPGGELAILTFAGKDATKEFNMIHPPDVIKKYAPDAVVGKLGEAAPGGSSDKPIQQKEKGPEPGLLKSAVIAIFYLAFAWVKELVCTIFTGGNFLLNIKSDRCGLTRSAMFLVLFITIHAFGNVNLFSGPDSFNGYGHMFVRLYWTGFGLQANIVEEYLLLAALLHIMVALMRTYEISMGYTLASGKLNLALTGVLLIIYMSIHLQQFRFAETEVYQLRTPSFYVNLNIHEAIFEGCVFHTLDKSRPFVDTRDIYRLEMDLFAGPEGWKTSIYYVLMVCIFGIHMCLGWAKVIPASQLGIPREYQGIVIKFGYALCAAIMATYISFPLYCIFVGPSVGMYNRGPNDY